jgi:hypothetical protein
VAQPSGYHAQGKPALQVLDDMSWRHRGRAARRRRSVRVASAQSSPTGGCSSRGPALGCTGRTGARVFSPDAHAEQPSGDQRRGPRRRGGGAHDTRSHTDHANRSAGEAHGDGQHKDMKGPGATCRRGRHLAPKLCPHPSPVRAGAWPRPCMCTRGFAVPARRSTLVTRVAARSVVATHPSVPAQETPARRPVPNVLIARRRRRP